MCKVKGIAHFPLSGEYNIENQVQELPKMSEDMWIVENYNDGKDFDEGVGEEEEYRQAKDMDELEVEIVKKELQLLTKRREL